MRPKTFNLISRLSLEYKDPVMVKRLIRDYVDANIAHIKATNVRNTCEIFVKGGIAFNDVFDDAKNLTA